MVCKTRISVAPSHRENQVSHRHGRVRRSVAMLAMSTPLQGNCRLAPTVENADGSDFLPLSRDGAPGYTPRTMAIRFTHVIRVGLRALAAHRLRSMLTALGIVLGVASVIIMLAVGEAAPLPGPQTTRRPQRMSAAS